MSKLPSTRAPKDLETFFRRLEILRYLAESPQPRNEPDIRKHLEQSSAFNIADPDKVMTDEAKKKSVGRDLKDLWESSCHNEEACEHRDLLPIQNTFIVRSGSAKQGYVYSLQPEARADGSSRGPAHIPGRPGIPEALALSMARRFLLDFIPTDRHEALLATWRHANEVLDSRSQRGQEDWQQLLKRIAIYQRGQRLIEPGYNDDFSNVLYHAIATGKCVEGRYQSMPGVEKTVLLHPYGVVFRLPKIYALAKPDDRQDGPLRQYLLNRFTDLQLSEQANRVPDDFEVMPWLQRGGMDILALPSSDSASSADSKSDDSNNDNVDVLLRIYSAKPKQIDNLIRDLQESRLADDQVGPQLDDEGHWQMCLPQTRVTFQLIEWILGRGDRVEVLQPQALREHIQAHLKTTLQRYQ